jgi:tetratricopeptide (TPR) repeat protein
LNKRFAGVVSKRLGLVVGLVGELGVGKSWLVRETIKTLTCSSRTVQASAPLSVLVRGLPRPARLPTWAEKTLARPAETLEPRALIDALVAVLSASAPFVLVIEDMHEVVPERLEFWNQVARAVRKAHGVGVLMTSRAALPEDVETLRLTALDADGSARLLEAEAGATLPPEALHWIVERAAGNPLFTLEYFRHLTRLGHLWSDARRWRWRAPEVDVMPLSVEALLSQLVANVMVSSEAQRALGAKAVLPDHASVAQWAEVADLEPAALLALRTNALQAVLRDMDDTSNSVGFVYPLIRDLVRRDLPGNLRRELAGHALRVLQSTDPEAAASLIKDAQLEPAACLSVLERAAQHARAADRPVAAARFLERMAEQSKGAARAAYLLEATRLVHHRNDLEAERLSALAVQADPNSVETVFLRAEVLSGIGRGEEAEQLMLTIPETQRPPGRWLELMVNARCLRFDFSRALQVWLDHPEAHAQASLPLRISVADALAQFGRFEDAKHLLRESMARTDLEPSAHAALQRAFASVPLLEGDFVAAEKSFDAAVNAYASITDADAFQVLQDDFARALVGRSVARFRLARLRDAIDDLEQAMRLYAEQGDGRNYVQAQANLGVYLTVAGEFERAQEVFLECRPVLERFENHRFLAVAEGGLAQLYLEWAPPYGGALAQKHAQAAVYHARRAESPPNLGQALFFAAWAEALYGQTERGFALSDELTSLAEQLHQGHLGALAIWVRGLGLERLGQLEQAVKTVQHAVENMNTLGHGPYANFMSLELDRMRGDANTAQTRIPAFISTGNQNWVHVAERYFPELVRLERPEEVVHPLRLEILGSTRVLLDGAELSNTARKGRDLLAVLLDARISGRREVGQLELFERLYPDMDETQATSALKQQVYRLRSSLGAGAVVRTSNGYGLGTVSTDVEDFLRQQQTALWRGPAFADFADADLASRDAMHHALRLRLRDLLPTDAAETVRLGRILLEAEPYDTEALTLTLRALESVGDTAGLVRVYAASRARFDEVGEQLPETWQDFLRVNARS